MSARNSAFTARKCIQTIFLVAALLAIKACDCKRDCNHYDYYQEMERALVNDTENLFKLQQIFFPTLVDRDPQDKVTIKVCVLISNDQMSKDNSTAPTERFWYFDYSSTLLTGLITPAQLHAFESITTLLLIETAVNFHTFDAGYNEEIHLDLQNFPCTVTDQELYKCLALLTSWFKAYARARGVPHKWKEEDKGYIATWYGHWNSEEATTHASSHHILRVGLLIAFIFLNITVTLFLLRFVPQYYSHLVKTVTESTSHAVNIFWALILFTAGWNTLVYIFYFCSYGFMLYSLRTRCFITDPSAYCPPDLPTGLHRDDLGAYVTKVVTLVITLVVYLLLAACTAKVSRYPIPYSIRKLCCCLSCVCCCCRSTHSKIIQTIVLWNTLLFIHFIAMTTIPIGTFLLLVPARTFLVLATFITFLFLITVVITHILEFVNSRRRNTANQSPSFCMYQCIQLPATVALLLLVVTVLTIYAWLLLMGADTRGAYGIVWSVLPSFILSLVGWYMKWKFYREQELQEVLNNGYSPLETDSDSIEEMV